MKKVVTLFIFFLLLFSCQKINYKCWQCYTYKDLSMMYFDGQSYSEGSDYVLDTICGTREDQMEYILNCPESVFYDSIMVNSTMYARYYIFNIQCTELKN